MKKIVLVFLFLATSFQSQAQVNDENSAALCAKSHSLEAWSESEKGGVGGYFDPRRKVNGWRGSSVDHQGGAIVYGAIETFGSWVLSPFILPYAIKTVAGRKRNFQFHSAASRIVGAAIGDKEQPTPEDYDFFYHFVEPKVQITSEQFAKELQKMDAFHHFCYVSRTNPWNGSPENIPRAFNYRILKVFADGFLALGYPPKESSSK